MLCNRSDNAEPESTDKQDGKMSSGNRLTLSMQTVHKEALTGDVFSFI